MQGSKSQRIVFENLGLSHAEILLIRGANELGHKVKIKTKVDPILRTSVSEVTIQFKAVADGKKK